MAKRASALVLLAALLAAPTLASAGEAHELVGGHEEAWWRASQQSREQTVSALEQGVATCQKTEAPADAGVVDGYGIGRVRGRPVLVPLKRCDDERASLDAARAELERFEDQARRLGVPPGWLR
jgi:hypothetical protein